VKNMIKLNRKLIFSLMLVSLPGFFIGCGSSNGSNSEEASLTQWYARTTVSALNPDTQTLITHKTAGVFGQLNESNDVKDPHDIIGMGTETATLEVVFPQSDWDSANGDYFSDYHSVKEGGDSWTFQVKNMYNPDHPVDLSNEAITIALDGIYTIESTIINGATRYSETLKRADERLGELTLIDLDNRVAYAVSELPSAEITMDGMHIRTFRWVLGTVDDSTFTPLVAPLSAKSATFRQSPSQAFQTVPKTVTKFGLPPQ
jgi:hypothetical protein